MANYFSIFLVLMTLITGGIWLIYKYAFAQKYMAQNKAMPALVDNAQQFFPVFALVMIFRSFIYEPFQIPSGSMMPTLLVGDFILVEKFSYGLKDPVWRSKMLETGQPERGDIVVFKYPDEEGKNDTDFIKRLVGLPGDRIIYRDKQIFVQTPCPSAGECPPAKAVALESKGKSDFVQNRVRLDWFSEQLGEHEHEILRHPFLAASESNYYSQADTALNEWLVPEGHYFVLGDNRDNSRDSRFWGFVPDDNLVGKAVLIWISFEFERDADSVLPSWVPTGIRFDRVGAIH